DLNEMIEYKRITSISLFPNTNYLDEEYGFEQQPLGILVVLFLLVYKKDRKGLKGNMAFLKLGLIIFDFVIMPFSPATMVRLLGHYIFQVALIFTVLSGTDIGALSILHSNMAVFEFLNASFSTNGKNRIFRASCLTIFFENIPQVIIQVLYFKNVVSYDTIPLFALISSCLHLLINIVGQTIKICRYGSLKAPAAERNFTSDE
ncbi:3352_t:CDS:2, partial [Diversispora eburnea]